MDKIEDKIGGIAAYKCDAKKIAERIKLVVEEKDRPIAQLTKSLGVYSSFIRATNGRATPQLEDIAKIANAFNVSIDYLIGRTDIRGVARNNPNSIVHAIKIVSEFTNQSLDNICEKLDLPYVNELDD